MFVSVDLDSANHYGCTAWQCPLRWRGWSAALDRTVRDLGAEATPFLRPTGRSTHRVVFLLAGI